MGGGSDVLIDRHRLVRSQKAHAESLPDWSEPSVEMIADAAKFDLDITDPDVRSVTHPPT